MPFDPKLIQPDDAPEDAFGEIDLPDDLLELAAQLGDDAAYLAERYPATATEPLVARAMPATNPVRRHIRRWVALASSAAALLVALGLWWQPQERPATPVAEIEMPTSEPPVAPKHLSNAPVTSVSTRPGPRIERLPWAPTPAIGEVTGPELEGLLDLWQNDEHPAETRIEI